LFLQFRVLISLVNLRCRLPWWWLIGISAGGRRDEGLLDEGWLRTTWLERCNWRGGRLVEGGNTVAE
jgi:hypothetical protein